MDSHLHVFNKETILPMSEVMVVFVVTANKPTDVLDGVSRICANAVLIYF